MPDRGQISVERDEFIESRHPLRCENAVAAILLMDDGRYLLQFRDNIPQIFYPNHWGLFGGAVHPDEAPEQALRRELLEELELRVADARYFTALTFDMTDLGYGIIYRKFYEIRLSRKTFEALTLHEGSRMAAFAARDMLQLRLAPYDAFPLWLHHSQGRLRRTPDAE